MTAFILKFLYKIFPCIKKRYPGGVVTTYTATEIVLCDAVEHVESYFAYAMTANMVIAITCLLSPYFLVALVPTYGVLIGWNLLYKELVIDGHLKRILAGTETDQEYTDMKADIITKAAGLLLPMVLAILLSVIVLLI